MDIDTSPLIVFETERGRIAMTARYFERESEHVTIEACYELRMHASYFVYRDHTLGYIQHGHPRLFGILSRDIHGIHWTSSPVWLDVTDIGELRPATLADFRRFRVDPTGHIDE